MAKDPICGMTVDEATALRAERDGTTHYFCSEHCRQKFIGQARPAKSIALAVSDTGHDCCGGTKEKKAGSSGDCCGGNSGHEAHAHKAQEHSCCGEIGRAHV